MLEEYPHQTEAIDWILAKQVSRKSSGWPEGDGNPNNQVEMPKYIKQVLAQPKAPRREAESEERTHPIRTRADENPAETQPISTWYACWRRR